MVEVEDEPVLLVNLDGQFFAVSNECTHSGASLSNGFLDGDVVECPLHGSRFNVKSGEVVSAPADEPLPVYAIRVEGEDVLVALT